MIRQGGTSPNKVAVEKGVRAAAESPAPDCADKPSWPGVKKCCVGGHGDGSVRCDADAVYLAQEKDGRMQWFVCADESHWIDVGSVYPLADWHARLDATFSAQDAHFRLTGERIEVDWRTIEVPGVAPAMGRVVSGSR